MEQSTLHEFVVRGTGHERDLSVQVLSTATIADVMAKVGSRSWTYPFRTVVLPCTYAALACCK